MKHTLTTRQLFAATILIVLCLLTFFATSCRKTDYYRQEFTTGERVALQGINPRKSPVPYDCCTCPCIITAAYRVQDAWFYDLRDTRDSTLTHVDNGQLRMW